MTDAELAELLRGVLARPDDRDVLRVYADVLIERGDARGELIALQLAGNAPDAEAQLAGQLSEALRDELDQARMQIAWREGFIDAIEIAPAGTPLKDTFRKIAELPAARRLRRIAIRCVKPGWGPLGPHLAELARVAPQLKALRELAVTEDVRPGDEVEPSAVGKIAVFTRACPKLEVLELSSKDISFVDLELPALRRLVLGRISPNELWAFSQIEIPRLEELVTRFRTVSASAELGRICAMKLPKLHALDVTVADGDDMREVANSVLGSALVHQLRVLALRGNVLDSKAVRAIAKHTEVLRKLERFEVQVTDLGDIRRLDAAVGKALKIDYGPADA
jgi:uncharacterized protein (TIGR02996 family)